jgi:hypothetical protein
MCQVAWLRTILMSRWDGSTLHVISVNPDGIHMWAVPQATQYLPKKVASYFFKNVLAILHARVSFYLHVKEDFKGIEKLFYVMIFHWLTNILTIAFPPESSNSSRWTHVGRHCDRRTFGIVLSFIISVCLRRLLAKKCFEMHCISESVVEDLFMVFAWNSSAICKFLSSVFAE